MSQISTEPKTNEQLIAEADLTSEVRELFAMIKRYRGDANQDFENSEQSIHDKKWSRRTYFSAIACLVAGIAAIYLLPILLPSFENPSAVAQGVILVLYALGALTILVAVLPMGSYFKDAVDPLLDTLDDTTQSEVALFTSLDNYSTTSIAYVSERLIFAHEQLTFLKSSLIGAVDKVGILPGVIATSIAFSQALKGDEGWLIQTLSFFIAGIYIGIYPILFSTIRFKQYGLIFKRYLKLQRKIGVD